MACHVWAVDPAVPYWVLVPVPTPTPATSSSTEYTFTFGRHKGEKISNVPPSYLAFCKESEWAVNYPGLRHAISKLEREHRGMTVAQRIQHAKSIIPDWFWNESYSCACQLYGANSLGTAKAMEDAVESRCYEEKYPPRPETTETELSSGSITALRQLLDTCPVVGRSTPEYGPFFTQREDGFTDERYWVWSDEYEGKVKAAFRAVQDEHGEEGLLVARWMARDKYAKCTHSLTHKGCGRHGREGTMWWDESWNMAWFFNESV
ncbi:uncharacterized protein EV420DRAFT_1638717 [Desarmillaria tabescens]|uniref:Uncharacterized protein n=1 Tax=Armillaria tabescens TaxID=1929756 RepID=A0AA39NDU6_ARMTA|nr:uncharacterized protein EV420DRAFT_1638717 [Desarmillaria tabescens]KAK0463802.1 hypothetical protein EV420DRAFT_1638717 [Desarmillaria tabescens]